jgi:hypothetical protein
MTIGQRKRLSDSDVAQLNAIYSCHQKHAQQHACHAGWVKGRLRCYLFVSDDRQQFYAAARRCRKLRGQLLSIDNKFEDEFIKSYLQTNYNETEAWRTAGLRLSGSKTPIWYSMGSQGRYVNVTYSAWKSRDQLTSNRTTLVLRRSGDGAEFEWWAESAGSSKQPDDFKYPYICEAKSKIPCFQSKTGKGRDYRGSLAYTTDGATCQRWTRRYPHDHTGIVTGNVTADLLEGIGNHNHCRNPRGLRQRPWCFTMLRDVEWQYCDVPLC